MKVGQICYSKWSIIESDLEQVTIVKRGLFLLVPGPFSLAKMSLIVSNYGDVVFIPDEYGKASRVGGKTLV